MHGRMKDTAASQPPPVGCGGNGVYFAFPTKSPRGDVFGPYLLVGTNMKNLKLQQFFRGRKGSIVRRRFRVRLRRVGEQHQQRQVPEEENVGGPAAAQQQQGPQQHLAIQGRDDINVLYDVDSVAYVSTSLAFYRPWVVFDIGMMNTTMQKMKNTKIARAIEAKRGRPGPDDHVWVECVLGGPTLKLVVCFLVPPDFLGSKTKKKRKSLRGMILKAAKRAVLQLPHDRKTRLYGGDSAQIGACVSLRVFQEDWPIFAPLQEREIRNTPALRENNIPVSPDRNIMLFKLDAINDVFGADVGRRYQDPTTYRPYFNGHYGYFAHVWNSPRYPSMEYAQCYPTAAHRFISNRKNMHAVFSWSLVGPGVDDGVNHRYRKLWREQAAAMMRRKLSTEFPLFFEEELEEINDVMVENFDEIYDEYKTSCFVKPKTFQKLLEILKDREVLENSNYFI
uniref:Uncharacterized protein n=1 Tax=Trichogramma kaykai TaxID=54128 RepID=A0ABD2VZI9_9HYME